MQNLYVLLGVAPGASADEVKSAFRRKAREAHPDLNGDSAQFVALKEAYAILGNPEQRAKYDQERRAWMKQIGAVECPACGHANRITHRPADGQRVRCWHCKTQLALSFDDLLAAQRQSLVNEAARVVDELGVDLADLAADAVHAGIGRLRQRFGLHRRGKLKP